METEIKLEERIGSHLDSERIREEVESPSRRDFLKRLGIGLAGYATFGGLDANAQSRYDNIEYLEEHLPPGILNCRDRAIRILYAQEVSGLWDDFGRTGYRMASEINGYYDDVIVNPWSRKIEPAWYLLREQMDYRAGFNTTFPDPPNDVPQMLAFDEGIKNFYIAYVYGNGNEQTKRTTEDKFVHSIAYAAYDDTETAEAKAEEYLESDMEGKTEVVMDIKRQFEDMRNGDRESIDPRDPYNRKLVASWSSLMLEQSYFFEQNRTDSERNLSINRHIEIPLREAVGFRIRGPPHYRY